MSPGALIAFYSYLGMLFTPVVRLVIINSSYQEAAAALRRINDIFMMEKELGGSSGQSIVSLHGRIELKDVSFSYADGADVLKDICFSVEKGETVGIVGASGAGKTTLIHLLVRFFDPQKGRIHVDGHYLKDLDLYSYREKIAVVMQDDYLFSGTVRENICYGRLDASGQDIEEAAHMAQAHDFISRLKGGYDFPVGDRGMHLSGGQRQRIAVARALLKNPSLLILDEATSAVDALTENAIQQAIRKRMKGKTVFIVAHRFSTIMDADKIIVLENGRVVDVGDHNFLLKKCDLYSNLYFEQFKEEDQSVLLDDSLGCVSET